MFSLSSKGESCEIKVGHESAPKYWDLFPCWSIWIQASAQFRLLWTSSGLLASQVPSCSKESLLKVHVWKWFRLYVICCCKPSPFAHLKKLKTGNWTANRPQGRWKFISQFQPQHHTVGECERKMNTMVLGVPQQWASSILF